jgi:hypothetical protein
MKTKTLTLFAAMTLFAALGITAQTFAQNTQPISASQTDPKAQAEILDQYGKLPLSFEANQGQTNTRVKFLSRGAGYTLFLTGDEAVLKLRGSKPDINKTKIAGTTHNLQSNIAEFKNGAVLRMKLLHANPAAKVTGVDELPGTSNYFIGNDPKEWRTNVSNYTKVCYEGVYPGVDLVYYGNKRQLEYDFVVAPGADPSSIRLRFHGAAKPTIDTTGDLLLRVQGREVRLRKPQVYQQFEGTRKVVRGGYWMTATNTISIRVGDFDRSKPLVLDPVLVYSTYLGGSGDDEGFGIAVDSSGNAYVAGVTTSTNFPTVNPAQGSRRLPPVFNNTFTAFVTKFNNTGSSIIYSTYLGGSNGGGDAQGIAVDSFDNAYVTGGTDASDFPTTPLAFQTVKPGRFTSPFVAKFDPSGVLVYSTYMGGSYSDQGRGIAVDSFGNAYITGGTQSTDFPATPGVFQPSLRSRVLSASIHDVTAFVSKVNAAGTALIYSTYLGGTVSDIAFGIAVDAFDNAYVTGRADSTDFPTTPGAFQTTSSSNFSGSSRKGFVSKLNTTGTSLIYSTYLGGNNYLIGPFQAVVGDETYGIAVDSAGNAYVTGIATTPDFPITPGAFQTAPNSSHATVFVTKLDETGDALVYSTYLSADTPGGNDQGIGVDSFGNAYVSAGSACPTATELNSAGSALLYSICLGNPKSGSGAGNGKSIAIDSLGNAYVTGETQGNFQVTPGSFQGTFGGGIANAFVAKIASGPRYSVCLLYDPAKAVHSGATIPIKLQLCDSSGNDLSSSSITVHAISVTQISTSTSGAVENAGNSNPDNDFRFDATLGSTGGYIFNLKTTGLSTGTYKVNFMVTGDSFVYAANFQVK